MSHRSEYYEQTCVALPEFLAIPRERGVRYSTILDRTGLKSAGEIGIYSKALQSLKICLVF